MTSPAPKGEIGSLTVLPTWGALAGLDPADPPAFQFPSRIATVDKMRVDPQIDALCNSVTMPVMRFDWRLNPNGARDEVVERLSTDLGVPIKGSTDPAPRSRRRFKHRDHLEHALLALWYGFMMFEQVPDTERYDIARDGWRLRKLAPRMPNTIERLHVAADGGLDGLTQYGYRPPTTRGGGRLFLPGQHPPQISVSALAAYVWRREGANWYGRSMLRPLYRDWILKDRALRVDAMKNERFGIGIPTATAPEGGDPVQYQKMAAAVRASETSGVGLPAGGSIGVEGIRGTLPDVMASIRYYDESMARAFMAMVIQLGQTQTGSRALGSTFADFFQMLVEAVANWYKDTTNEHVIEDIVDWNWDEDEQAPLLEWAYAEKQPLAVSDLVAMTQAGVITMDRATEDAIRQSTELPALPPLEEGDIQDAASSAFTQVGLPALVQSFILTPEEARQLLGVTGPAPVPAVVENVVAAMRPHLPRAQVQAGVRAALGSRLPFGVAASKQMVGDRTIGHRQPNAFELAAKTNFEELQERWQDATASLVESWKEVQAGQIDALVSQVEQAVDAGDNVAIVNLDAPVQGQNALSAAMKEMAEDAIVGAKAEAVAQGVKVGKINMTDDLVRQIERRAEATAVILARSLADSAARKAINLGTDNLSPEEVAASVREHLEGLSDSFLNDMLGGAMTQAQNTGRRAVMKDIPAQIYASELLDGDTCTECSSVDAREYATMAAADADYPTGGYKACKGGPRCRGTLVAVYEEGVATPPPAPPAAPEREPGVERSPEEFSEHVAGWAKNVKKDQKEALRSYAGQTYLETNTFLRTGTASSDKKAEQLRKRAAKIQDAILSSPDMPPNTNVFRGIGAGVEFEEGAEFLEPAFTSTTSSSDFAMKFAAKKKGSTLTTIRLKDEGQKGAWIDSVTEYDDTEMELLLPAGTKYRAVRRLDDVVYTRTMQQREWLPDGRLSDPVEVEVTTVIPHWELEVID